MKRTFYLLLLLLYTHSVATKAQVLTQTNLPIIIITTNGNPIGNSQALADMKIVDNGAALNHPVDAPSFQGLIGIKLRGSANNPKQSYNVETWANTAGGSLNTPLLGMPAENDWVLLACYTDRSLIRDLIGFHIFRQMGNYAPAMRLVEVMIDNNYQGVYLFGEKIKRDVNRVDIATLKNTDNSGLELTGGYIFRIDNSGDDYWISNFPPPFASGSQDIKFHYEEPKDNEITPVQKNYIKSYTDSFEAALNSAAYQDTNVGWRRFAGKSMFSEFFVFNEITRSADAYRKSTYLYKDKGKKLRVGPPWDLELSLYNTADCNAAKDTGWAYQYAVFCGTDTYLPPFWWGRLATDTMFLREAKCKYTNYRSSFLDTNQLWTFIDSLSNQLNMQQAQQRNFQKWPIWGVPLVNEPQPLSTSYAEEVAKIKSFLARRLAYLDAQWLTSGCALGISGANANIHSLTAFPNPAGEVLHVSFYLQKAAPVMVAIRDIYGRTLQEKSYPSLGSGSKQLALDISTLTKGIYFITIIADKTERRTLKIVKE